MDDDVSLSGSDDGVAGNGLASAMQASPAFLLPSTPCSCAQHVMQPCWACALPNRHSMHAWAA